MARNGTPRLTAAAAPRPEGAWYACLTVEGVVAVALGELIDDAPAGSTAPERLIDATTPHEVAGWDGLASDRSFYVGADWLRFADTDGVARSRYLGRWSDGRLVAALSAHWAPDDIDAGYVAARTLDLPATAPAIDGGVLTLGGRRGFLSGALVAADLDRSAQAAHLAALIHHATHEFAPHAASTGPGAAGSGTASAGPGAAGSGTASAGPGAAGSAPGTATSGPGAAGSAPGGVGPGPGAAWWWPYLTSPDVDVVLAAGHRLAGPHRLADPQGLSDPHGLADPRGPGVHLIGVDCVIDVVGTTLDDHVTALPTQQRRTNLRREQKRFRDSGLEIARVDLGTHWPRLGPLLASVQHKYGHPQSADEMSARLRRQAEHLGSRAVVFACFAGDTIIGFALAYHWGDELALRVVGFDYERLVGADEYAQLAVHAPLRYCYEHGLTRLHLGTASYAAKCRRGARPRPLWAVTSLPGPGADSLTRTLDRIAASLPAHEAASLTAQARHAWQRWTAT